MWLRDIIKILERYKVESNFSKNVNKKGYWKI